jgi:hypothetical protein
MTDGGMRPHPESLYYHIAADAVHSARAETDEFKRKQLVTTSMVFSALCLEAFINQQYNWGRKRVSLRNKWLTLPAMLGSPQTFVEGHEPFLTFAHLVDTRNRRLVHFSRISEAHTAGGRNQRRYFSDLVNDVKLADSYV